MHVELLVEEQSMEAFLRTLLPKLLPETCSHEVHPFQCKDALRRKIADRLRGYAHWLPEDWRVFVLVDRDDDDCAMLKAEIEANVRRAGLRTRSQDPHWQVATRIVVEELEAWYFGDWQAVLKAYPKVSPRIPGRRTYRDPDGIVRTWEAFERILKRHGYFKGGLRKTEAARAIAEHVDPDANRSRSFLVFYRTLMELAPAAEQ
ncbi:MAG: DUF4276 family protein [Acidobacteria bacterium]|nr:DUF4276 family protein [Acidobacteriota bacterium]